MMSSPIPYSDDLEIISPHEDEAIAKINESMHTILETVAEDENHAYRAVHAKSHGILEASLTIPANLPDELAQGIFALPGRHDAILRFSTNPGDVLDDSVSVPRGLALKVLSVEGERLSSAYDSKAQDFVMINGPAFSASSADDFANTLKLLAATTDRAEWAKKLLSATLRGIEKALEATVGGSATIQTLGGAPNVHPLGETFYSQTPYRYGNYVAKFQVVPVSSNLTALSGTEIDAKGRPNALREEIDAVMRTGPAEWELRVQLLRDRDAQPIEDATVIWDEERFPFQTVARITAGAQTGWNDQRAAAVDDAMRFAPWNGVVSHRPLGSINRARKSPYEHSAKFRERVNGCPIREPRTVDLPA